MAENLNLDPTMPVPSGLSAQAIPQRIIRIEFGGNNETSFEIWRRHGDTVDWYRHASTNDTSYEDTDVKPGQYYEYKVRAVRADSASEFSPSAVAYGAE